MYKITPMNAGNAKTISVWEYPGEYAVYSFSGDDEALSELMNGEYFSCEDERGDLIGYYCFGASARIPTKSGYAPDSCDLDIGLGMIPSLCGHGCGKTFMRSGIEFAKTRFNARGLRLAVAQFNKRAIALYKNCGFIQIGEATHESSGSRFLIMRRNV